MRDKHWTEPRLWRRLKPSARAMRHAPTSAEEALWKVLRARKLDGLRFRRQHPIGQFIVDFYCAEANLAVEVDGAVHSGQHDQDEARDRDLNARGVTVLRITNDEALNDPDHVLRRIREFLTRRRAGLVLTPARPALAGLATPLSPSLCPY